MKKQFFASRTYQLVGIFLSFCYQDLVLPNGDEQKFKHSYRHSNEQRLRSARTTSQTLPRTEPPTRLSYVDCKTCPAPPLHLCGDGHCHSNRGLRIVSADTEGHFSRNRHSGHQRHLDL